MTRKRWNRTRSFWVAGVTMSMLALTVSGCAEGITAMTTAGVRDADGMTRGEVERLTREQRFDLLGQRYERMKELLTEAQEQVSTGPWRWLTGGAGGPFAGPTAWDTLRGATGQTSYYLELTRSLNPPGAAGDRADAEPVYDYFESKGWDTALYEIEDELDLGAHSWDVRATTDDGYYLRYRVQESGYYNMEVTSGVYWCDRAELSRDVSGRIPRDEFFPPDEISLPGVYVPFPKWSDPKLWGRGVEDD